MKVSRKTSLAERIAIATAFLTSEPDHLTDLPHPNTALAQSRGLTLRDYAGWLLSHAGAAGKLKACKLIERG